MYRFALFVDGSNLIGTLRRLNIRVDDYERFYRLIFDVAVGIWTNSLSAPPAPPVQLERVYWYVVGSVDEWDLTDAKAQVTLRDLFNRDANLRRTYMALAGQKLAGQPSEDIAVEAWTMCFDDMRTWYDQRVSLVEGFRRFHHAVRFGTEFIDVIECGHWKVDLLNRTVAEKGLDTRLAVDMVTTCENYDVAVLLSGDADNIPSIDYVKARGKHVAVVDFLAGYPPEKRGGGFSPRLKVAADYVVQIYEMDLVTKAGATKGT